MVDAVGGQVFFLEQGGGFSAAGRPADAHDAGGGQRLGILQPVHLLEQAAVDVADGQYAVDLALLQPHRVLGVGHLGRAGGEEENADLLRVKAGLFHRPRPGQGGRQMHGRRHGQHMLAQMGEPRADQPDHRRTGG